MASKSKKTQSIRDRKARPNKQNLKANEKRLKENLRLLQQYAAREASSEG